MVIEIRPQRLLCAHRPRDLQPPVPGGHAAAFQPTGNAASVAVSAVEEPRPRPDTGQLGQNRAGDATQDVREPRPGAHDLRWPGYCFSARARRPAAEPWPCARRSRALIAPTTEQSVCSSLARLRTRPRIETTGSVELRDEPSVPRGSTAGSRLLVSIPPSCALSA